MTLAAPPTDRASRRIAQAVLCLGLLMVVLDGTIISVALPSIQRALSVDTSRLAWVVNAYLVPFGGLLLLAGRVGDLVGRRRMFLAGVALFTAASLLCGMAQTPGQLIGARFLQGIGGAMASAVILAMLAALFPEPAERARAFAVYAFVGAAGASIGTATGGVITDALDWRWIFLVNVPIGIVTIALALRTLDRERGLGAGKGADLAGAVLLVVAVVTALLAIVGAADHGLGSTRTLGLLALAALLLLAFAAREARARTPLVPLRIVGVRSIAVGNVIQLLMIGGYFGQQFIVALELQHVLGYRPADVGLAMLAIPIAIAVTSIGLAARLIDRLGARAVLLIGMALAAASLAWLARTPTDGRYLTDLLPAFVAFGAGAGLSMPAVTTIAMSGAAPADAGLASGLLNTTQQIASAASLAVLATIAAARSDVLTTGAAPGSAALAGGYGLALLVAALLVVAAIGVALAWRPADGP